MAKPYIHLYWTIQPDGSWHELFHMDMSNVLCSGVYAIGFPTPDKTIKTVYVGQGVIHMRLNYHRESFLMFRDYGSNLKVTWTPVAIDRRSDVEGYLNDKLRPLEGERHPRSQGIAVNLPEYWIPGRKATLVDQLNEFPY